jgi:multidrug efflux pump
MVSISNFVTLIPTQKTGTLERVDSKRVITIQADVEEGLLVDDKLTELRAALKEIRFDPSVNIEFKGEDEEQRDTIAFLGKAFATAIFLMAVILVTQFNSFYQMLMVLSAIVFSTAGILLGLLITAQPFGIVMVGIGIIALAGIVVNNNIVLIDTFNVLRSSGMDSIEAAMRTGAQRLRPVILTAVTTVLGLMPMVLSMNIDFINRSITFGAPSSQWWTQLSTAIAGGLTFATLLTLILTPCLLVLGERLFKKEKVLPESASHPDTDVIGQDKITACIECSQSLKLASAS